MGALEFQSLYGLPSSAARWPAPGPRVVGVRVALQPAQLLGAHRGVGVGQCGSGVSVAGGVTRGLVLLCVTRNVLRPP